MLWEREGETVANVPTHDAFTVWSLPYTWERGELTVLLILVVQSRNANTPNTVHPSLVSFLLMI